MSNVTLSFLAFPADEIAIHRDAFDLADLLTEDRALSQTNLEPVVVRRIMAAGYHHSAVDVFGKQSEVERGRGHHSNIENVAPGFGQAFNHQVAKPGRAFSRITPEARSRSAVRSEKSANRASQIENGFVREIPINNSPDVVLAKDVLVHIRPLRVLFKILAQCDAK